MCSNLFVLLFLVTSWPMVAVQPCMEWIPIKKKWSVSTFMKREGCPYIWFIKSSLCRVPNEWHEIQAKTIHYLTVKTKSYCRGSLPVVGSYYLVMYEGELIYKCLEKANAPKWLTWKWPVKKDEHDYQICDVKQKIRTPNCYWVVDVE